MHFLVCSSETTEGNLPLTTFSNPNTCGSQVTGGQRCDPLIKAHHKQQSAGTNAREEYYHPVLQLIVPYYVTETGQGRVLKATERSGTWIKRKASANRDVAVVIQGAMDTEWVKWHEAAWT